MANEERKCPMDCARCSLRQNMYCAAQIGLSSHEAINRLTDRLTVVEKKLSGILLRVDKVVAGLEALQTDLLLEPMAQEGEEAQTIDSQNNQKPKDNELQ